VGIPAANSLSRIFVRVGNGLNGPTFTIPDSMPGSLDCAARELQSPGYSVVTVTNTTMPQALNRLRNSSTTVMRRMLASIKSVEEVLGGGLLLIRHYHAKNRDSGMVVCKLLILKGKNNFFCELVNSLGEKSILSRSGKAPGDLRRVRTSPNIDARAATAAFLRGVHYRIRILYSSTAMTGSGSVLGASISVLVLFLGERLP